MQERVRDFSIRPSVPLRPEIPTEYDLCRRFLIRFHVPRRGTLSGADLHLARDKSCARPDHWMFRRQIFEVRPTSDARRGDTAACR